MLFLTRKAGQAVIINDNIEVNVIEITGKTVKLGFKFPQTERVLRQELFERIKSETAAAAFTSNNSGDNIATEMPAHVSNLESVIKDVFKKTNSNNTDD